MQMPELVIMKKHISYLLWGAFTVGFLLLFAQDGQSAVVPVITGNGYSTRIMLLSGTFQCPAQQLLPPKPVISAPAYVDASCLGDGVRELAADGYADIFYRAATTSHFAVSALSDIQTSNMVYAVSNDDIGTWINLLGSGFVFAFASDAAGNTIWSSTIQVTGATQVEIPVRPGLIILRITTSDGFGHTSTGVRGFVTYGLRSGGSDTVIELK